MKNISTTTIVEGLKERIVNAAIAPSVGVILPSNNYNDFIQAIGEYIKSRPADAYLYVTITNPFERVIKNIGGLLTNSNIKFIDCVSRAAGIETVDNRCIFIESPTHLEKILLDIMNNIKQWNKSVEKYVIIDSLSSFILYNDSILVAEFYTYLCSHLGISNTHIISLCIEEEMDEILNKIIYLKSDRILKVRESFI
ncbi:MAG: hypothetical protein DRN12_05685 [Thermoplasmata archaeon]|nr:MAG: hypothetical protein DRN12_05685 [Thermoplasmata archaeon]